MSTATSPAVMIDASAEPITNPPPRVDRIENPSRVSRT